MGWIKRNMFWFEHHSIYIEPTEQDKLIHNQQYKVTRNRVSCLAATISILSNMNNRY